MSLNDDKLFQVYCMQGGKFHPLSELTKELLEWHIMHAIQIGFVAGHISEGLDSVETFRRMINEYHIRVHPNTPAPILDTIFTLKHKTIKAYGTLSEQSNYFLHRVMRKS